MKNLVIEDTQEDHETNQLQLNITIEEFHKLSNSEIQDFIDDVLSSVDVVIEGMNMTNQLTASEAISYRAIMKIFHALELTASWINNLTNEKTVSDDDILGLKEDNDEL